MFANDLLPGDPEPFGAFDLALARSAARTADQIEHILQDFNNRAAYQAAQIEALLNWRRHHILHDHPEPESAKATEHLDVLYLRMKQRGGYSITYKQAAELLGLSKTRINQLSSAIRKDLRFDVVKDPRSKQRFKITLRNHIRS